MNIVDHAQAELERISEEPRTIEGYLDMIRIFSRMGHSGGSASVFIPVLNALLRYENLSPLTDDPEEWVHHDETVWGERGGIWQNTRNSKAFSKDGGKTYYLVDEKRRWWTKRHRMYRSELRRGLANH